MENVLNLKKTIQSNFVISFSQNRLNIFIEKFENLFEPPIMGSYADFEHFYKNIYYFILFVNIVEDLKLNVKIWGHD